MGTKVTQTNFTAGVADPLLVGREDQQFYYNALSDGHNVVIQPQGGAKRRDGLRHVREILNVLEVVSLSGATVTAPEGGTAGNVHDDDVGTVLTTSGNLSTTNPFVVVHVDFTDATAIDAIDIVDYLLSSGSLEDEFFVQYSDDNSAWSNYGAAFNWGASARSRRLRNDGGQVTARYWRVVRVGDTDIAATATIAEIRFWAATSELSNSRLVGFANEASNAHMMLVTDKNVDILSNVTYEGSVSVPYDHDDLAVMNWTQSQDTMLLFHGGYATQRLFRQGAADEFDYRNASFVNIPKHNYGAGTGGVDEIQVLNDGNTLGSGDKFTILLEGARTTTITAGGSRAASAAAIQGALRALDNTASDGISVADSADSEGFDVTFSGGDGSRPWLEMSVSVLTGNSVWTVSRTTKGEYPGEDIFSDDRGHPGCGVFYQSRLWVAGIPGLPNAALASVVGIVDENGDYDLDIDTDDDARGLLLRADTDQVSPIYQIVAGRNLTFFAEDIEFYIPNEPIDINAVLKLATRRGIKEGLRVFEMDGALVFLQKDGSSLREFIFVDTEQSYEANNISVLSSHLIRDPVDMDLRKAVNTDEADLLLVVNSDGTTAALSALRKELVSAFTEFYTRSGDRILNVGVDKQKRIYFVVERVINGVTRRFLEKLDSTLLLDGGGDVFMTYENFTASADQDTFTYTFSNPAAGAEAIGVRVNGARLDDTEFSVNLGAKEVTLDVPASAGDVVRIASMVKEVSGLDHLAGEDVQTYIDGSPGDTFTVSEAGVLTLNDYADISIQYGFFFGVYLKLMDLRFPGSETLAGKIMRVYRVILSLYQTGHVEIRCNGGPWREVPLQTMDSMVLDKSLDELLYDGEVDLKGIQGYRVGGVVEIRQSIPAPFNVRNITREVSL